MLDECINDQCIYIQKALWNCLEFRWYWSCIILDSLLQDAPPSGSSQVIVGTPTSLYNQLLRPGCPKSFNEFTTFVNLHPQIVLNFKMVPWKGTILEGKFHLPTADFQPSNFGICILWKCFAFHQPTRDGWPLLSRPLGGGLFGFGSPHGSEAFFGILGLGIFEINSGEQTWRVSILQLFFL